MMYSGNTKLLTLKQHDVRHIDVVSRWRGGATDRRVLAS